MRRAKEFAIKHRKFFDGAGHMNPTKILLPLFLCASSSFPTAQEKSKSERAEKANSQQLAVSARATCLDVLEDDWIPGERIPRGLPEPYQVQRLRVNGGGAGFQ